jgi:epoxyqueuosine reductase QueG
MKGISRLRHWGHEDPVMIRLLKERGLDEIPLFRRDSPKMQKADWGGSIARWVGLAKERDGPVNPGKTLADDPAALTAHIKQKARDLGASDVGCAELAPIMLNIGYEAHQKHIISIIVAEDYAKVLGGALEIESEAIRVYVRCAELATELAKYVRALGYPAVADHNGSDDIQAIPALYACGMGELGKHGSLIHPEFGAGFRPGFVRTDAPLVLDAPRRFGVQDYCMNCKLCANNCPPAAIPDSEDYIVTEGVKRWLTDIERCYEASRLRDEYCHICVDVCPYVHKENGDEEKRATYKHYLGKRRTAGYRTPAWFIEDEDNILGART